MVFNKDKDTQDFVNKIVKIAPEEFIALAQLLDVKMSVVDKETGKYALRDAEDILNECII